MDVFYSTLFSNLAKAIGIDTLSPNLSGRCELVLDDKIPIALITDNKGDRLLLISMIDLPEKFPIEHIAGGSLDSLYQGGPGIGFDETTKLVISWIALSRSALDVNNILRALKKLVECVEEWELRGKNYSAGEIL